MLQRLSGRFVLVVVLTLALAGCFRQANPDIEPPPSTIEVLPTTSLPESGTGATPFVTPFAPGEGPDITNMPTLAGPSPTVPLIDVQGSAAATPTGEVNGILPGSSPVPTALATVPFAAGATFTPMPGAPPVNLNPNPATSTPASPAQGNTAASTAGPSDNCTYFVQAGDTAFYIATLHGVTLSELIEYNGLENADFLYEGQELQIPNCGADASATAAQLESAPTSVIQPPAVTPTQISLENPQGYPIHVVQAGENLFRISLRYGVTVDDIVQANNLGSADAILRVGQQLIIPTTQ
jgi:LysM repeat protein